MEHMARHYVGKFHVRSCSMTMMVLEDAALEKHVLTRCVGTADQVQTSRHQAHPIALASDCVRVVVPLRASPSRENVDQLTYKNAL